MTTNEHAITRLSELVGPLSTEAFLEQHWATGRPHLSAPNPGLVAKLKAIDELTSAEALLSRHKHDVRLFGPDAFRSVVSPKAALDFLEVGYNLYILNVEDTVPAAKALLAGVASDLGMAPFQLRVEAFAGAAGGVSSYHYDHDINFQILLDGEKEWVLEENRNIINPLQSFHPARDRREGRAGLREEAYADDPDMPFGFDAARSRRLLAKPGAALFLPRSAWHEARSLTTTFSVNLVLRSTTVARALGKALEIRLHQAPEFRAYCEGVAHGARTLSPAERAAKQQSFDALKAAAKAAIDGITLEEAALSMLSLADRLYAWSKAASAREVVDEGGGPALRAPGALLRPLALDADLAPFVRRLCAAQNPLRWEHVRALGSDVDAMRLYRLVDELVGLGLLVARP